MRVEFQNQTAVQVQTPSISSGGGVSSARQFAESQGSSTVQTEFSPEDLRRIMEGAAGLITDFLSAMGRKVSASVDEVSGVMVVRVVNPDSGEVIRQIPSEEVLGVLRYFNTSAKGVLVSQAA